LALAFVEDAAVHDIARALGIGEESVRTHLRRGRAAVAARLKEANPDE
jgi:DNA-directed RNA polymerase specialized sigma24 family protein